MVLNDLFALIDCVPTPIFVMDVRPVGDPVYAHYNEAARRAFGRPLSDFVGRTTAEVFGSTGGALCTLEQHRVIAQGKPRRYEYELSNGEDWRIMHTTLCPQHDSQGRVRRLIGSINDTTAEWSARNAQEQLRELGTEVEQFVHMAAHDLRAPLRNVMMLSEMLREDTAEQDNGKRRLIDMVDATARKSLSLVSDVLDHAASFKHRRTPALFDVAEIVEDLQHVLDPHRMHHLHCNALAISAEKPVYQIVLRNLIENAMKHGRQAGLSIQCEVVPVDDDHVQITVSDNGGGFDNPGSLFLETGDFRVDSGYGLWGIRRLIRARGGTINASNAEGGTGGRVRCCLPAKVVKPRTQDIRLAQAMTGT